MSITGLERSALQATLPHTGANGLSGQPLHESYSKAVNLANSLQMILIVLFTLIGAAAAPLAFSNTSQLNIFWLLLILLGAHFLSLLLWFAGLLARTPQVGGQLQWFSAALQRIGKIVRIPAPVLECFLQWRFRGTVGKWAIGRLVHACWAGYLLGGLCSALLYLMTHQVHFVWETTLLTQQDFYQFTQWLSVLPSWLGAPTPSLQDIQMSQIGVAVQGDDTRKLWGLWILACILIYGVLLRLICTGVSHVIYRRQRLRLWTSLQPKARPRSHTQILDADSDAVTPTHSSPAPDRDTMAAPESIQGPLDPTFEYYLFEWSKATPTQLTNLPHVHHIQTGSDQADFLQASAGHKILVVDADISPDRGSLRFISQANTPSLRLYLHGQTFVSNWCEQLHERGIAPQHIKLLEA